MDKHLIIAIVVSLLVGGVAGQLLGPKLANLVNKKLVKHKHAQKEK